MRTPPPNASGSAAALVFLTLVLLTGHYPMGASAQWEVPVPVILDGTTEEDRQVIGLQDPIVADEAVNVRTARAHGIGHIPVVGMSALQGELVPAPAEYRIGMVVTIVPDVTNAASATLELNGLGPRFIVKSGEVPLNAGDLIPGMPARLVFTGTHFQLISGTQLPCPQGYTTVNRGYCISNTSNEALSFYAAANECASRGARLCTIAEWGHACRSIPAFLGTVLSAEWVDHAANNNNDAKLVGAGSNGEGDLPGVGCERGGNNPPMNAFRYRCCAHR